MIHFSSMQESGTSAELPKKESLADRFLNARRAVEESDGLIRSFLEGRQFPSAREADQAYADYLLAYQDQALAYAALVAEAYLADLNVAELEGADARRVAEWEINKTAVAALMNQWRAEIREPAATYEALCAKTDEAAKRVKPFSSA